MNASSNSVASCPIATEGGPRDALNWLANDFQH
jgi:hypothetical protein